MKKILLSLSALLFITVQINAQQKPVSYNPKKDISKLKPVIAVDDAPVAPYKAPNHTVKGKDETTIGTTRYDLPTNQSNQNRIYMFPDKTIGATWNFGVADPNFADRGTGYNYYNGSIWLPNPTNRVESIRAGWPSYFSYGASGEAILSHDFAIGNMLLNKRSTKGTGSWTQTTYDGPSGYPIAWPRTVSNGTDHNQFHMITLTKPTASGGTVYQGLNGAILYSRSLDGGNTWDIKDAILPGMTSSNYKGFGGDTYAMADPKGNTLAFVVGDNWTDLFLMKSTDNGTTWTKTMIFQHPYPMFDETTTLVLDTPWVCDGSLAVALDNNGKAHVCFGLMRVLNDDLTDGSTSYFPYTDGLAYWNEDKPAFPILDFDVLYNNNDLVGYLQDMNGNDTVMEFVDVATYYLSLTSMPSISIDNNNDMFVAFSSVMENLDNGNQNYRHIWTRQSFNGGLDWSGFYDETHSIQHTFDECVFPSMSPTSDINYFYFIYQADEEPGLAVRGDEDPYTDNNINFIKALKGTSINEHQSLLTDVSEVFPNPANGNASVKIDLAKPSELEIVLLNNLGQSTGLTITKNYPAGETTLKLNLQGLAPGVYFCSIKAGDDKVNRKVIVQ